MLKLRINPSSTISRRSPLVATLGMLLSVALHALLIAPLLWGGGDARKKQPERPGTRVSADRSGSDAIEVQFIEETASSTAPDTASAATTTVSIADLATIPVPQQPPGPDTPSGEDAIRAQLYGRYLGQISARIERAWLKPRSSPGPQPFVCRVQILQDANGAVLNVRLKRCNGDPRWQASLVSAIQTASPLPAPPNPRVFTRRVAMHFQTEGYAEGGSTEGFEPDTQGRTAMVTAAQYPFMTR